jgi:hypothetical protein
MTDNAVIVASNGPESIGSSTSANESVVVVPKFKSSVLPRKSSSEEPGSIPEAFQNLAALQANVSGPSSRPDVNLSVVRLDDPTFDRNLVLVNRDFTRWANTPRMGSRIMDDKVLGEIDLERLMEYINMGGGTIRTCIITVIKRKDWTPEFRRKAAEDVGEAIFQSTDLFGEREAPQDAGTAHADGSVTPPKQVAPPAEAETNGAHPPELVGTH